MRMAELLKSVGVAVMKFRFAVDANTYLDKVEQGQVSRSFVTTLKVTTGYTLRLIHD